MDVPLQWAMWLCASAIAVTWLLSVVTREYSWVDRIWSIIPPVYVALFAIHAGDDPRLWLMTGLTAVWGARLTFNYWRKGGYAKGGEDYRWGIIRQRLNGFTFQVFNATFISPYQNALLLLISLPAYAAWQHQVPLTVWDGLLAVSFLGCTVGEFVADQQQWDFHQDKHARQARGEVVSPPFLTTGLWRYSRHPNFFFEQMHWWLLYGFTVVVTGEWLHVTIAGPVLLTLLFDGSTRFTETITVGRYPSYRLWQQETSRIIPLPKLGRSIGASGQKAG